MSFHPTNNSFINLYEIVDNTGTTIWGAASAYEAVREFRSSPLNCRLLVSAWESDADDARLIGQPIDITSAVVSAIAISRQ
jgi:hypothetical protein